MAEISRSQLVSIIRTMVDKRESGSVLISDQNNHSGIIAIKKGAIIAISYGVKRGMVALPYLQAVQHCTYRINNMILGRHTADMMSTKELLTRLEDKNAKTTTRAPLSISKSLEATKILLTKYAGPVASVIMADTLSETGSITSPAQYSVFVKKLSKKIPNTADAKQFIVQCSRIEARFNSTQKSLSKTKPPPKTNPSPPKKAVVDDQFLMSYAKVMETVGQIMTRFTGPVAPMIIEDVLEEFGSITSRSQFQEFIKKCSKEISDATEAFQFIEKCDPLTINFN